jgi:uncharacterized protein YdeI (YjbR/CyaY-like superfamily)
MAQAPANSYHPLSRQDWRSWLKKHYAQPAGIWLINYKKNTGKPRLEYDEIVEEALCFGWVDSLPRKLDDEQSMLWVAPRKTGSNWSALNKQRIEKLLQLNQVHAAGLAKIAQAKKDGSWTALDQLESGHIPPDLDAEFQQYKDAKSYFEAFPKSVKKAILEWILNAKKPETRQKRVAEVAKLASVNQRANQ